MTTAASSEKRDKIKEELESKNIQLHWLLQITKAINYNLPALQLFDIYQSVLINQLKVGKLLLFLNEDGKWNTQLAQGFNKEAVDIDPEKLQEVVTQIQQKENTPSWFFEFDSIIPVLHNDQPLAYALIGDLDETFIINKKEIITFIHTITNIIVVAIENKRLMRESIQQAAMNKELELAADMQAMLFPQNLHTHDNLEIAAYYLPHRQVGGDYYDFIKVNEEEAFICMADVSGKGIAAAFLMSNFQAHLHAMVRHHSSLKELLHELNKSVNKSARGEKFITFFIAQINYRTRMINYVNAGHNPPLLYHNGTTEILEKGTTGLGMFEELPFLNEGSTHFPPDSILFCYTDGVTDLENGRGDNFGMENIKALLHVHTEIEKLNDFHQYIMNELNRFRENTGFTDDVTILSCRLK